MGLIGFVFCLFVIISALLCIQASDMEFDSAVAQLKLLLFNKEYDSDSIYIV